jgi:hypothetical protein
MKAVTIHQPWAWAMILGVKRIENRTWRTLHRGPLVIHAGRSRKQLRSHLEDGTPVPAELAFGAFLGVVDVVDCVAAAELPPGPFLLGPYCWVLANPRPFPEPLPWPGAQSLWNVPEHLEAALRSA